jgi:hypothetical protein
MKRSELQARQTANRERARKAIETENLHFHHSATRRGYCRAEFIGAPELYEGRFGSGILVRRGNIKFNRYCRSNRYEVVDYYVK